jgi:hypothetical protein
VTINTTLLIFCGQKFSYAGGDDEYLANESEYETSLRVRANENVAIKSKNLDGYGCDVHLHDDADVDGKLLTSLCLCAIAG